MWTPLLTLALLSLSPANGRKCSKMWAGINTVRAGLDMTQMDILSPRESGFRRPSYEFTCNDRKKQDLGTSWGPFDVPDQVEGLVDVMSLVKHDQVHPFIDGDREVASLAKITGQGNISLNFPKGLFAESDAFIRTNERLTSSPDEGRFELQVFYEVNYYKVKINSERISIQKSNLSKAFDALPEPFKSGRYNKKEYQKFVEMFGTHTMKSATFGGRLGLHFDVPINLLKNMSMTEILESALQTLHNRMGEPEVEVCPLFLEGAGSGTPFAYGGAEAVIHGLDYDKWATHVKSQSPLLMSCTIQSLVNLLPSGPKKEALINAMILYIEQAGFHKSDGVNIIRHVKASRNKSCGIFPENSTFPVFEDYTIKLSRHYTHRHPVHERKVIRGYLKSRDLENEIVFDENEDYEEEEEETVDSGKEDKKKHKHKKRVEKVETPNFGAQIYPNSITTFVYLIITFLLVFINH
jgi:hypothetical protein